MAGDNLNVWFDPEGDHLDIVLDQKAGHFEDTALENVMRKRDAEGNLLALSIFNLSSFARRELAASHGRWAVFNLEVDDGATFDFDVALGYQGLGETEGETDPESTSVLIADPDARARCSIFFRAPEPPGGRRVPVAERILEILHKPLSSPVISVGEDPLAPVSLTSLCLDQLALSLRLFQPQSFFIAPLGRRREVRGRARYALTLHPEPLPCDLRGSQIEKFREFAERIGPFHRDRSRYRVLRWDWIGSALATQPDEVNFLKQTGSLMIATDLFDRANSDPAVPGDLRLLLLVMAAEALFTDDDRSELGHRLASRVAVLNGAGAAEIKQCFALVRLLYEARSKLMHGTAYVPKPSKRLAGVVGAGGVHRDPTGPPVCFQQPGPGLDPVLHRASGSAPR
jgi:hypothetical protein